MKLQNLQTKFLGKNAIYFNKIDSTQEEIWRLYNKNAETGTLVYADIQTKARGTHGRKWYTDKENNIAFSFFINMDCNIKRLDGLTIEIAEIIVNILKEKYDIDLQIKKPNDLIYNNKKIGGILTETKITYESVKVLACGIGINNSQTEFAKDIEDIASSIKKEFNKEINVVDFISEFCNKFEKIIMERIK